MKLLTDLFSTDYGLMSFVVIAVVIAMGFWFRNFFVRNMEADTKANAARK